MFGYSLASNAIVNTHLLPAVGPVPVDEVTRDMVEAFKTPSWTPASARARPCAN